MGVRAQIDRLGRVLAASDVSVELSERWECPGPDALAVLHRSGTRLIASTDSHRSERPAVSTTRVADSAP